MGWVDWVVGMGGWVRDRTLACKQRRLATASAFLRSSAHNEFPPARSLPCPTIVRHNTLWLSHTPVGAPFAIVTYTESRQSQEPSAVLQEVTKGV